MNFGNPYYYAFPSSMQAPKIGMLGRLFGTSGSSIGSFINGTQKVLNIANQAIPLIRQMRPIVGNAKTMFKIMHEFKNTGKTNKNEEVSINVEKNIVNETTKNIVDVNEKGPKFFI